MVNVAGNSTPDLTAENLTASVARGADGREEIRAVLDLVNRGSVACGPFTVTFTLTDDADPSRARIIKTWEPLRIENSLDAGGRMNGSSYALEIDGYTPKGDFYLRVELDRENEVQEADEENNVFHGGPITLADGSPGYILETFLSLADESPAADTVMELYVYSSTKPFNSNTVKKEDLTLIRSNDDSRDTFASLSVNLKPGVYFIRVYGSLGGVGNYNFYAYPRTPGRTGLEDMDPRAPGAYEPNGDPSRAGRIILEGSGRSAVQGHSLGGSSDEDWLYIIVE